MFFTAGIVCTGEMFLQFLNNYCCIGQVMKQNNHNEKCWRSEYQQNFLHETRECGAIVKDWKKLLLQELYVD